MDHSRSWSSQAAEWAICLMIFLIEVLGLVIKHAVLGIRLLANIVAGHLVLASLLAMISTAAVASPESWGIVAFFVTIGSALMSILELAVCFLQAYVFTFLGALWLASVIHSHGDHDHEHEHGHDHAHAH